MGHNFGMSHDFADKHGGHSSRCNFQGIMSYDDVKAQWTSCSVRDFTGYFNSRDWGNTCLKGKYLTDASKFSTLNFSKCNILLDY